MNPPTCPPDATPFVMDGAAGNDDHTLAITKPLFDGLYRRFYQSVLSQRRT